jgi:hypothetical protein
MTLIDLLSYLGTQCKYPLLDGNPDETLEKSLAGSHANPLAGEIIKALYEKPGLTGPLGEIDRASAVNALGPIRLVYMKDDAPAEGFRLVEDVVHKIDGAFNAEAQRLKARP